MRHSTSDQPEWLPTSRATGLHIVQVSRDHQLLAAGPDDEPMQRQMRYAQILRSMWAGSQMTIIVLTRQPARRPFHQRGLLVITLSGSAIWSRLRLLPILALLHRRHPIDVVTTQTVADEGVLVLLLGNLLGLRVVGQIHWDLFSGVARRIALGAGLVGWVRKVLALSSLRHFFALRVVGSGIQRELMARGLQSNTQSIPVPVEFSKPRRPIRTRSEPELPHILFVGRLVEQKNLESWLEVARLVAEVRDDVTFDVVGDGPMRKRLETLSHQLGLRERVRFHGWVRHDDLPAFYTSATVFLLTSWFEGFGRVLVEAYRYGVPCVSSRITGPDDIIDDGVSGYLHAPDDTSAMAQSVLLLLADKVLRDKMGEAGRLNAEEKFDPHFLAHRWVHFLVASARRHLPQMLPPRTRTWARYKALRRSLFTSLRSFEYEAISGMSFQGLTLDVGGGAKNSYWHLFRSHGSLMSVNISRQIAPTVVSDLNRGLPFADESFDNVVSFNTFEHIFRDEVAIRDSLRVLRCGGQFHFIVPLLYQVHASPFDFHRHTADWWAGILKEIGICPGDYWIDAMVWDRVISAASLFGYGTLPRLIRSVLLARGLVRDLMWPLSRRPFNRETESDLKVSLGLHIFGIKR